MTRLWMFNNAAAGLRWDGRMCRSRALACVWSPGTIKPARNDDQWCPNGAEQVAKRTIGNRIIVWSVTNTNGVQCYEKRTDDYYIYYLYYLYLDGVRNYHNWCVIKKCLYECFVVLLLIFSYQRFLSCIYKIKN